MSIHILAGGPGPAMFLGASIMSFALPYAAFIVIAAALFVLFRAKHSGPRLKYLPSTPVTSVITREPGPVPAPAAKAATSAGAPAQAAAPETGEATGQTSGKDPTEGAE